MSHNSFPAWKYPVASQFYSAMAALASSTHNLPHFLGRAQARQGDYELTLVRHNVERHFTAQSDAIGWASRD